MATTPIRAVGISWFREEDYPRALAIMTDAQVLPGNYLAWREKAEQQERRAKASGYLVIRAVIDPDEFPGWCRTRGLDVDANGRRLFAAWFAMTQVKEIH